MKNIFRILYGLLFIAAGTNHFLNPAFYEQMIPSYLPSPKLLNIVSGIAEIGLGALLLWPSTSQLAAWGLIALLVAIFPANLQMALNPEQYPQFSEWSLWLRLPFQAVFIGLAYWLTKR